MTGKNDTTTAKRLKTTDVEATELLRKATG
jgi:hypothetical protein